MIRYPDSRWLHAPHFGALMVGLFALLVRLWSSETVPYSFDEAQLVAGVQDVLAGHWPVSGQGSSWGLSNPPLLFYLLSIPYVLGGPAGIIVALALENAIAVMLVTWFCARQLGNGPGLLAGLVYAASPWTIFAARQPWTEVNQLLQALAVVAATQLMLGRPNWWGGVAILAVAANGLGYLLGSILGISLLVVALLSPRRWFNRWSAAALAFAIVAAMPYLTTNLLPELQRMPELALQRGTPFNIADLPAAFHLLELYLGGANLEALLSPSQAQSFPVKDLLFAIGYVVVPLFGLGLFVLLWGPDHSVSRLRRAWIGWSLPPLAILLFQPRPEFLRYETVIVPLPFLWLAALFATIWRWRIVRRSMVVGWLGVALLWVTGWWLVLDAMALPSGNSNRGTFASWSRLVQSVPNDKNSSVFVVGRGFNPDYDSEPAIIRALAMRDRPLSFLDGPTGVVGPKAGTYIVTSGMPVPTWAGEPLPGIHEVGSSPAGRVLVVSASENVQLPAGATAVIPPVRFSGGPELRGFRVVKKQGVLELATIWHMGDVDRHAPTSDLTMFNHVLDAFGRKISQIDGFGLRSSDWQPGQWIAQTYQISVPSESEIPAQTLFVGIYSRLDKRALVLDPRPGQPPDGVLLPLN